MAKWIGRKINRKKKKGGGEKGQTIEEIRKRAKQEDGYTRRKVNANGAARESWGKGR